VNRSLCDVLPSVAAALGVPGAPDRLELVPRLGGVRRVAVVLVDGLGRHLLPRLAPHAPLLAAVLAGTDGGLDELACTFPSTTPTSLVSFGTGARPGEHGVLGFTVAVPGTDRVLTHITWRDDPDPRVWQPVPTWFARMAAAGVDARAVLPAAFVGSGLTEAAYGGGRFVGVAPRADYGAAFIAELAAGPGLVFGYTSVLDTAAHVHGVDSAEWAAAATVVDALLRRLRAALPPDAVLLVTADHGGLDIGPAGRVDCTADPDLRAGVRLIAGEPRVRYVHVRPGAATDVRAAWAEVLGADVEVLLREEAIAADLFGPVREEHRERIGDVVVICRGQRAVFATDWEPPEVARLVGLHGSDTAAETAIPLVLLRPAQ
jgi:hypothetical protein